jgi:hypothetical protein
MRPPRPPDITTILGAVIESCTGMPDVEWAVARLFNDKRFDHIRRPPVDPALAATYKGGPRLNRSNQPIDWANGIQLPEISSFAEALMTPSQMAPSSVTGIMAA